MPVTPTAPLRAVVFDLDGTLIDSAPGLRDAAGAMLAEMDLPEPDLATVISFIGNGAPKLVERCLAWAGADPGQQAAAFARFMHHYNRDPISGTVLYPGAQEMLTALAAEGLNLGLCTNKPEGPTRTILDALALGPFGAVVGGDSLAVRKPDPSPLLTVIARLGADPASTVYVGDSVTDWRTAQAAGVAYVHMTGGYQVDAIPDFAPWLQMADLDELPREIRRFKRR